MNCTGHIPFDQTQRLVWQGLRLDLLVPCDECGSLVCIDDPTPSAGDSESDTDRQGHGPAQETVTCPSGKITYATEAEAEAAVDSHKANQGFSMLPPEERPDWSSYRCPMCERWHLTSGSKIPPWFGKRVRPRRTATKDDETHGR